MIGDPSRKPEQQDPLALNRDGRSLRADVTSADQSRRPAQLGLQPVGDGEPATKEKHPAGLSQDENQLAEGILEPVTYSERQQVVLAKALDVLVSEGEKGLTTAAIARAANCSKESLYKWFGDRDGLLAAIISYQASKVLKANPPSDLSDLASLRRAIERFAEDLLTVLAGETSLALNRLAIGQASRKDVSLGTLLIERGRAPIRARASALLEEASRARLVTFTDTETATRTLYGLIVGDRHVDALLGARPEPTPSVVQDQASRAADQFLTLFGVDALRADNAKTSTQTTPRTEG